MKKQTANTNSSLTSVCNGRILLPDGRIISGGLTIERGRITRIGRQKHAASALDARGGYVIPGLIDIHTPGIYDMPLNWGRVKIAGPNNGVRMVDRGMGLAGSALTPINGFRNAIRMFHKDLATASRLCSGNPARLLGLNKGEIAVGRDADLLILSSKLEVLNTVVGGKIIFRHRSQD